MAEQQQSSAAASAVTTPPAVTTSTTIAQARAPSKNFVSTLEMIADEKAAAPPLEPAFEALSFGGRKTQTAKGNGKKGGKKSQEAATSGAARSSAGKTFDEILKDPAAKSFMTVNHQNGKVYWHFQKNACTRNCKRLHECAGCGKPGIGYVACRCQASRV